MNKKYSLLLLLSSFILMSGIVDLNNLFNYSNQEKPNYISKDNTPSDNTLTDPGATLGRVLFYDKKLSKDNTISCSSCHHQKFAFGDTAVVSKGVNGVTGRHSMRLVNPRFSDETKAFWDERAMSLEDQSTKPVQDHVEMGFSGKDGDPDINDLIVKLKDVDYYKVLFRFAFGDSEITESRIQKALAQFERSIQSYDSKYDEGRAQVTNNEADFPNFTDQENEGKSLFFTHPPLGGAGCARCHNGSEFSIISNCNNNGIIGVANDTSAMDLTNTKAPSLRNLVNPDGVMGPFMHDGSLKTLMEVVEHYNHLEEVAENTNLDFRLAGNMHQLDLPQEKKEAIVAFLHTLSGVEIYSGEKWSNPFDENGNITVVPANPNATNNFSSSININIFPNPTTENINIELKTGSYQLIIFDRNGKKIKSKLISNNHTENMSELTNGFYIFQITDLLTNKIYSKKIIKR